MSGAAKGNRHLPGALALGAILAIVAMACGGGPRPDSSPAPAEPAPEPAAAPAAPAAPAATPETELEPSAEQLPLAEDFSDQAEDEITASNYRSQLDALEREILPETPARKPPLLALVGLSAISYSARRMSEAGKAGSRPQPWFVAGDLDGFFGLAIDNLIQFLLILGLCSGVLGFPMPLLLGSVLPAAALSVLVGNVYYAHLAQRLSAQTGRHDVTALPYGINTVSLFAFVFLVMLPVKIGAEQRGASASDAALIAWRVGLAACFLSGAIELLAAPFANWVRRTTPRAALLATLSGIAISFIAIDFAVRTFQMPLLALLPLAVILTTYFSGVKLPFRIPGGAWAVGLGTAAAWLLTLLPGASTPVAAGALHAAFDDVGFYPPVPVLGDLIAGLTDPLTREYLVPVTIPMALFNVLGSLQNLESAEAAGDAFPTAPCLTVNGIGSLVAAALGSCFPTTIYIGHPGWKALGARSGYSILNGVFFTLIALFGLSHAISAVMPIEAGMAIVLWIGIVITAQAFSASPRRHAPAVALGLFPAIAGWGVLILTQTLGAVGAATGNFSLAAEVLKKPEAFASAGLALPGLVALSQGFMLTCLIWSGASANLIDRKLWSACRFMLAGAALAFFGFIHAGTLSPAGGVYTIGWARGTSWAIGYLLSAGFFALTAWWVRISGQGEQPVIDESLGGHG